MADEDRHGLSEQPSSESAIMASLEEDAHEIATAEHAAAFHNRFLRLLERRTAIYTMGDSTSVPKHVAVDLLRSVCFVLGIDPDRPAIPYRLLSVDLEDEFRCRLAEIERKIELTGELWRQATASAPAIPNVALHDTIASIGDFPSHYDFRSMAHEIPVVIDYPLCHPVADDLLGVDYINEYLRRLLVEFEFLGRFEPRDCMRVLERSSPDYVDLPLNLYAPVATNAIGRAVIGFDPVPLSVSQEERAEIVRRLEPLASTERRRVLREAALAVCDAIGMTDEGAREYLRALVSELLPRTEVGLAWGELRGVFA